MPWIESHGWNGREYKLTVWVRTLREDGGMWWWGTRVSIQMEWWWDTRREHGAWMAHRVEGHWRWEPDPEPLEPPSVNVRQTGEVHTGARRRRLRKKTSVAHKGATGRRLRKKTSEA